MKCVKTWKIRVVQDTSAAGYICNPQLMVLNINSPWFVDAQYSSSNIRMETELGKRSISAPDHGQKWDFEQENPFTKPQPGSGIAPNSAYSYDYLFTDLHDGTGDKYKDFCVTGARFEAQFTPLNTTSASAPGTTGAVRQGGILFSALMGDVRPLQTDATNSTWDVANFRAPFLRKMPYTQTAKFNSGDAVRRPARIVQNYSPKMLNATKDLDDNRNLWGHIDSTYTSSIRPGELDFLVFGVTPYFDQNLQGYSPTPIPDGILEVKVTQTIKFSEPLTTSVNANAPLPDGIRVPGGRADRYV